jgi:ADP-ribosyl-[dinitrogen reductase] hydrolase
MAVPFPRSRFVALFLGGALGDSLGASVEFADTPEIQRNFPGLAQSANMLIADAHLTDDTQTTLWVAEGLVRAHQKTLLQGLPSVDVAVRDALLRWYITQEPGERKKLLHADSGRLLDERRLFGKRSPDNTNLLALAQILNTPGFRLNSVNDKATESPGALMRVAPYAVFRDVEECFEYALRGASITHPNPAASAPAAFYAALLHGLLRDMPWPESYARALALLESQPAGAACRLAFDQASSAATFRPDVAALGGGWTAVSALSVALCVFRAGLDSGFEHGVESSKHLLLAAVLHSGKSDTIGALVGQLLGAQFGQRLLPKDWLPTLEARGTIEGMASDLYDAWVVGSAHDSDVYPAD